MVIFILELMFAGGFASVMHLIVWHVADLDFYFCNVALNEICLGTLKENSYIDLCCEILKTTLLLLEEFIYIAVNPKKTKPYLANHR